MIGQRPISLRLDQAPRLRGVDTPILNAICLAGPTAAGKSSVALELARLVGGEIVSVDSMQVYSGLDIGTAKPTPEERRQIAHHLIDVVSLRECFDAADFVTLARAACAGIASRNRTPILCGGTGLYFKALFEGLPQTPEPDAALRAAIESTPMPALLDELRLKDPRAYERIDRMNPRRVMRAIEVIRLTRAPFSEQRADWSNHTLKAGGKEATAAAHPRNFFVLDRDPEDLRRRIEARVDQMFQAGLVQETEDLLRWGLSENRAAMQAIGYRQVVAHLNARGSLHSTMELVKTKTRQFAKRQRTWFRTQCHSTRLLLARDETAPETARRVLAMAHLSGGA